MSYNIGQFRRDMLDSNNYLTQIGCTQTYVIQKSDAIDNINFKNTVLRPGQPFSSSYCYYVRMQIERLQSKQQINIYLRNQGNENSVKQYIMSFSIPSKKQGNDDGKNTVVVQTVFSPNTNYNELLLLLSRTREDYLVSGETIEDNEIYGREVIVKNFEVNRIYNILNQIQVNNLSKIGIQGPSGLLMCINGEGIRIPPSGIYQIKIGYKITFIGFIIKNSDETPDKKDYFILDYQY